MSLRLVLAGFVLSTAIAFGLIGYQIASFPRRPAPAPVFVTPIAPPTPLRAPVVAAPVPPPVTPPAPVVAAPVPPPVPEQAVVAPKPPPVPEPAPVVVAPVPPPVSEPAQVVVAPMPPPAPLPSPPPPRLISYLVAARPLPAGQLARMDDFTSRSAPADLLPPGAILDTPDARADLRGALVRRSMDAGTPPMDGDLIRPRERGFLAAVLAPGTRAVTIGIDQVTGLAGLIWPGDRVDVIVTQDISGERVRRQVTSGTALSNVRVIAIDPAIDKAAAASTEGRITSTVTFQVDDSQAERLAVAVRLGRVTLAVRSTDDDTPSAGPAPGVVSGGDVSVIYPSQHNASVRQVPMVRGGQRGGETDVGAEAAVPRPQVFTGRRDPPVPVEAAAPQERQPPRTGGDGAGGSGEFGRQQ